MKNKIKYFFSLLAGAALLTSCFPDPAEEALAYNGPTLVEFKNQTLGMTGTTLDAKGILRSAGNTQTDSSRVIRVDRRSVDTVLVQLIGPQRNTETVVNYSFLNSSPYMQGEPATAVPIAVEGTDFEVLSSEGTVTIPANSSVGRIIIDPLESNLEAGANKVIGIKLEGSDQVGVAKNYDTFWIRLRQPM